MAQYVFSMNRVGKIVPPKRQILKDISLSFFPGAKIGVLGTNGSGKSTLLKIMAGLDKENEGEAIPMAGLNIGYLPQEPQPGPTQTVRESVEAGMGKVFAAKARLEEVYTAYGAEDADFDALAAEQAELEAIIATAGTHSEHPLDNAGEWIRELDRGSGIPYKGNYSGWLTQKGARLEAEQKGEEARAKALKKELEWSRQNPKARQAKSKARLARFDELSDYEYQKRNETNEIFIPVADRLGSQVIEFKNVTKSFGDRVLIENLSFNIPAGAIVVIIGPNGAVKSTLFNLIAAKEKPDAGEVVIGSTVKMAFVDQHRDDLSNDKTVWEDVSGGLDILNVGKFQMASRAYCGRFNFNGGDQQKKVGMLSGGERGRLHLAKTLIAGGNVLMLDEPSNDLDVETLRALEDALLEFAGTMLVISHDRWFLDRIATHILAAEGDSQRTFFDGNYQEYEADKKKLLCEEGAKPKRMRFKALKLGVKSRSNSAGNLLSERFLPTMSQTASRSRTV